MMKRILLALALVFGAPIAAQAASNSGCMPISGLVSGVEFAEDINAGFRAVNSSNSGATAPLTDCSNTTLQGQLWFNTGDTFGAADPGWEIWDGVAAVRFGFIDPTNHLYMPQQGGGIATATATATFDPCSVPQDIITVSGATAITSFGSTCIIGQWKDLAFASAGSITQSSNIQTPNGQNINFSNGDIARVLYLGSGVWRVQNYQTAGSSIQPGMIFHTAAATADPGYLLCSGANVSRTTYANLFARIGTTYGSGDGSTTFGLPDERGRAEFVKDNLGGTAASRITAAGGNFDGTVLGASGGQQSNVVAHANLAGFNFPNTTVTTNWDNGTQLSDTTQTGSLSGGGAIRAPAFPSAFTLTASVTVPSGGSSTPLPTLSNAIIVGCEIKY